MPQQDPGSDVDTDRIALNVEECRRLEWILRRLRLISAALLVAMALLFEPWSAQLALALATGPVLLSVYVARQLRRTLPPAGLGRLRALALAGDVAVALAVYLMYLGDPQAMPIVLFIVLMFELAAGYGTRGVLAAVTAFAVALGVRVAMQLSTIEGGSVRLPMLLLWCSVAVLMIAFARQFRSQEAARTAASRRQERIESCFRMTVDEVLARVALSPEPVLRAEVVSAIRELCEESGDRGPELARDIASRIAEIGEALPLSRREREVATLLAEGCSYAEIAARLFVSDSTVRNHVHRIKGKLGLESREQLVDLLRSPRPSADAV